MRTIIKLKKKQKNKTKRITLKKEKILNVKMFTGSKQSRLSKSPR